MKFLTKFNNRKVDCCMSGVDIFRYCIFQLEMSRTLRITYAIIIIHDC